MGLKDFLEYPDDLDGTTQCKTDNKAVELSEEDIKMLMEYVSNREPRHVTITIDACNASVDYVIEQMADQIEDLSKGAT